jgi:hypothetical protein
MLTYGEALSGVRILAGMAHNVKSNAKYWKPNLRPNRAHDKKNLTALLPEVGTRW